MDDQLRGQEQLGVRLYLRLYWKFLDGKFFGHNEDRDHHARLGMLTKAEAETME